MRQIQCLGQPIQQRGGRAQADQRQQAHPPQRVQPYKRCQPVHARNQQRIDKRITHHRLPLSGHEAPPGQQIGYLRGVVAGGCFLHLVWGAP